MLIQVGTECDTAPSHASAGSHAGAVGKTFSAAGRALASWKDRCVACLRGMKVGILAGEARGGNLFEIRTGRVCVCVGKIICVLHCCLPFSLCKEKKSHLLLFVVI